MVAQILIYAWAVAEATLILIPIAGMGIVYTLTAILGSGWFVWSAYQMYKKGNRGTLEKPMSLFHLSNIYLALLFIAIAIDPLIKF